MKAVETVWSGRFPFEHEDPVLSEFNRASDLDTFLFDAEVRGSRAWVDGLHHAGVLDDGELAALLAGLDRVSARMQRGEGVARFEDVHAAVELLLVEEAGAVGRKLHTGRSRNEQVATDERIWLKERFPVLEESVVAIQARLVELAARYPDTVMPAFTHLQQAQCVLFAHYVLAFFWALERGRQRLRDAACRVDVLPLGSGAVVGSTVPVDRNRLADRLGFARAAENSIDAVTDRSFILETLFAMAMILLDLARLAEDMIVFSTQGLEWVDLPPGAVTSSSLMPQKRNPDVFELIRTGPGRLFGHLTGLFMTVKGLPTSYNKDLQADKRPLREGVEDFLSICRATERALTGLRPRSEEMRRSLKAFVYATDMVDWLVDRQVPFREAHLRVAQAESTGRELDDLTVAELQAIHPVFDAQVAEVFDPVRSVSGKRTVGSTHPEMVRRQLGQAQVILAAAGFRPGREGW